EVGDSVVQIVLGDEGVPTSGVSRGEQWCQPEYGAEVVDGPVVLAPLHVDPCLAMMGKKLSGVQMKGLLGLGERVVVTALVEVDHGPLAPNVGSAGVQPDRVVVCLEGVVELASLIVSIPSHCVLSGRLAPERSEEKCEETHLRRPPTW